MCHQVGDIGCLKMHTQLWYRKAIGDVSFSVTRRWRQGRRRSNYATFLAGHKLLRFHAANIIHGKQIMQGSLQMPEYFQLSKLRIWSPQAWFHMPLTMIYLSINCVYLIYRLQLVAALILISFISFSVKNCHLIWIWINSSICTWRPWARTKSPVCLPSPVIYGSVWKRR